MDSLDPDFTSWMYRVTMVDLVALDTVGTIEEQQLRSDSEASCDVWKDVLMGKPSTLEPKHRRLR